MRNPGCMQTVNASITLASNNFKEINCCSNLSTLDLDKNSKWLTGNEITLNITKTKFLQKCAVWF